MKNSNDIIGSRTRNLQVCSAVPQVTAPPRSPIRPEQKVKQSHYRPRGFQEVKVPRFRQKGTGWW